jgi:hypothetical protein
MGAHTDDIAHVIQLAIAPVFLLSSLGTVLAVLSTRLGRIVDRTRVLLERLEKATDDKRAKIDVELQLLVRRRGYVNSAITAATVSALLICLLIAVAFLGSLVQLNTGAALAALFVLAMVAYVTALLYFLREVLLASRSTVIEFH